MFENEKQELINFGIKVFREGLVQGTGGNLSLRVGEEGQFYLITPSGMDYNNTHVDDIVVMDMDGKVIEGNRKPSIEHSMHRGIFKKRKDINAIIHTHSLYSMAMSLARQPLPMTDSAIVFMGGQIEVAEYARHGSQELADNVVTALGNRKAAIMANHGMIAVDVTLQKALKVCVGMENSSRMYILARVLGKVTPISDEQAQELRDYISSSYGQK